MNDDFEKIIFGFLQAGFSGQDIPDASPDFEECLRLLAEHRTLQARSFLAWPVDARQGLRALLTEWLIVFRLAAVSDEPMAIPPGWLDGSSSTRLNEQIVAEILHRSCDLQSQYRRRMQAASDRGDAD